MPDEFVPGTFHDNPLEAVQIDEMGPLYIRNETGKFKFWLIICIEIVTRQVYLVPMRTQSTVHFIMALEILQSRRGKLCKIVLDAHSSHAPLVTGELVAGETGEIYLARSNTLNEILARGQSNILQSSGITVIVAPANRHKFVGLAENTVYNVKKCLINLFPTTRFFHDLFEVYHKISLIETYLNDRPSFALDSHYIKPNVFRIATLKHDDSKLKPQLISDLVFPQTTQICDALVALTNDSKQMLNALAADLSKAILNYRNTPDLILPEIGDWVYVKDRTRKKHFNSLKDSIFRVKQLEGRCIFLQSQSGRVITRSAHDIIRFKGAETDFNVDILDLPIYGSSTAAISLPESQFNIQTNIDDDYNVLHNAIESNDNNDDDQIIGADNNIDPNSLIFPCVPEPLGQAVHVPDQPSSLVTPVTSMSRYPARRRMPTVKYLENIADATE